MCRMLGIAADNGISPLWLESFHGLAVNGKVLNGLTAGHDDGWGVAGYLGKWAVYFGRSEKDASRDIAGFDTVCGKAVSSRSKVLIAHFRKASEGAKALGNTHPFIYKDMIFCHNGDVHNSERLVIPGVKYEGTTDSERLFRFIASRLETAVQKRYAALLPDIISEIKDVCPYSSLTFLLSNGERLIGYRDFTEEENYYTLHYAKIGKSFIFCSEPLPGFEWKSLGNGELLIVNKHGVPL
jgi:predicted glutamine amidotransferase